MTPLYKEDDYEGNKDKKGSQLKKKNYSFNLFNIY